MKHIHIFGIVLLVAFLTVTVDAVACDNFEAKLEAAQTRLSALQDEKRARDIQNSWVDSLFKRANNEDTLDDIQDDLDDLSEYLDAKGIDQKIANAEQKVASAQADLDNCLELTEKVNIFS